jgi:hypothetical protein
MQRGELPPDTDAAEVILTVTALVYLPIRSESAVRDSGVPWTILRPSAFMSNALRWLPQLNAGDVVRAAFASVQTATVDPYDIAAVAAQALRRQEHEGRVYQITGLRRCYQPIKSGFWPSCSAGTCGSRRNQTTKHGRK